MSRPKSKSELEELSQSNYKKLLELVNAYSKEEVNKTFPEGTMNRNVRDVLAHLHHWHIMLQGWYNVGMQGRKPDMPAKGYKWNELPDLNKKIREIYQDVSLDEVKVMLQKSYSDIQIMIHEHTNEELFEKEKYKWTGSTSLSAYLISNSSSHYAWAIKLIKKAMK